MKHDPKLGRSSSFLVSTSTLAVMAGGILSALRLDIPVAAGLCLFFLLLGLVCRWWSRRVIENVQIRLTCSRTRLFPGQQTTIRYTVENRKLLPLVWLELSQNGPDKGCLEPDEDFEAYHPSFQTDPEHATPYLRQSFSFVGSFQTVEVDSTWTARCRGLYPIEAPVARSGDGFGLAQREQSLPVDDLPLLAVYPRQRSVDLSLFLQHQWDCAAGSRGWMEDNTILRGNREYLPGDNWKHINWRMAARGQGLPVNQYESIQPKGVHFILDGESFCGFPQELETALEVLSSILMGLSGSGMVCSLSLPRSRRFPAETLRSGSDGAVDELMLRLAGYECLAEPDPNTPSGQAQTLLPSRFPVDVLPGTGSVFLITRSGQQLPVGLTARLDPGRSWVLSLTDSDAPARLGLRGLSLTALCREG